MLGITLDGSGGRWRPPPTFSLWRECCPQPGAWVSPAAGGAGVRSMARARIGQSGLGYFESIACKKYVSCMHFYRIVALRRKSNTFFHMQVRMATVTDGFCDAGILNGSCVHLNGFLGGSCVDLGWILRGSWVDLGWILSGSWVDRPGPPWAPKWPNKVCYTSGFRSWAALAGQTTEINCLHFSVSGPRPAWLAKRPK